MGDSRKWEPPEAPPNAGKPWLPSMDGQLRAMWANRLTIEAMAERMGRTEGSIIARLENVLGLDPYAHCVMNRDVNPYVNCGFTTNNIPTSITYQPKKDHTVNLTHLITLLQKDYTTVGVVIAPDVETSGQRRVYTYKVPTSMGLKVDDLVVVPTHNNATDNFKIARVLRVDDEPEIDFKAPYNLKWVVQKVDRTQYDEQVVRETTAMAHLHKAEQKRAQEEALATLFGGATSREELLKILNG